MELLLFADIGRKTLSTTIGGGALSWPNLVQGDALHIALRYVQDIEGETAVADRLTDSLKASVGRVDIRPTSGVWRLQVGAELSPAEGIDLTEPLAWDASAAQIAAALNDLFDVVTYHGEATVTAVTGGVIVTFANVAPGAGPPLTLQMREATLEPRSFLALHTFIQGSLWGHELRLTQAPVAFTSSSAVVVPPAPLVTLLQGGSDLDGLLIPEIQKLYVHPWFRGTYQLAYDGIKTDVLSAEDGPAQIQDAINAILPAGYEVTVTNPQAHSAHIEFGGEIGLGDDVPLLTVSVFDAPPGDVTFTLDLDSHEAAGALRAAPAEGVELSLEIEVVLQDLQDPEILRVATWQAPVKLVKEQISDNLAARQAIDWLHPPLPRDYVPFVADQVITGNQHYSTTIGGAAAVTVEHDLGTEALHVTIRENTSPGEVLVLGTHYTLQIEDRDSVTVTFLGDPPAAGSLAILITSAGPAAVFQAHNHTIAQIVGLQAALDAIVLRLVALEAYIPSSVTSAASEGEALIWPLPDLLELLPVRRRKSRLAIPASTPAADMGAWLGRGGLLPAVWDAAAENLPGTALNPRDAGLLGKVYLNAGTTRRYGVAPGNHLATDGERFFEVVASETAGAWFPREMEAPLWRVGVNERVLPLGTSLAATWGFEQMLQRTAYCAENVLLVEYGTIQEKEGFTGDDLELVDWQTATPLLRQRIIITSVAQRHDFALNITHKLVEGVATLVVEAGYYGHLEVVNVVPATAQIALRARLVEFDTEDSAPHEGYLLIRGLANGEVPATVVIS